MKVGDLVALRLCQQAGKIGMITGVADAPQWHQTPKLALYWVLLDTGNQCFTGDQLIRHKWMENESR
jgi:hypothetical protein